MTLSRRCTFASPTLSRNPRVRVDLNSLTHDAETLTTLRITFPTPFPNVPPPSLSSVSTLPLPPPPAQPPHHHRRQPNPAAIHPSLSPIHFLFSPFYPLSPLTRRQPNPAAAPYRRPPPPRRHHPLASSPLSFFYSSPSFTPASTHHRGTPSAAVSHPSTAVSPRSDPPYHSTLSLSHFLATALPGSTASISANS
nr:velvet complex subunit B-like [Arachis hypogaea]